MEPIKHSLDSRIIATTVLQNRAVITRKGMVKLVSGDNRITLTNLPLNLVENSVRVNGEGPEGAKILGVELKKEYLEEVTDEKLRELEKAIEASVLDDTRLKNELDELNVTLAVMSNLSKTIPTDMARGYSWKKLELTDVDKALKYLMEQTHTTHGQVRSKNIEIKNLAKRIQALQGELSKLQSKGDKEVNAINVDIEAAKPGDFDLTLEYVMEGASWYPLYDARVLTEDAKVDFTYYGLVQQATGENWKSTVITLSTAPDSPSTQLPELQPWYISAYAPPRPRSSMLTRGGFAKADMKMAEAPGAAMESGAMGGAGVDGDAFNAPMAKVGAVAQTATVSTSGEAVVYKIEKPTDIESEEESPKKLTVGLFKLPTEIRYLAIPKVIQEVYTKAKVTNDSEFMLLPGDVNLFADSEFIGVSTLGTVAPTEKFDFSLGITRAIKVKRELVKREVSSAGLTGKGKRVKYAYRIKVENNKKVDIKITVKDQLPVPQHEKIKIEDVAYGDKDEPSKKTDLGILEWTFTLPPGKKKIIDFEFCIVYPQDMTIEGEMD
jgi:uncharacterized protein (TIGR02231 family)